MAKKPVRLFHYELMWPYLHQHILMLARIETKEERTEYIEKRVFRNYLPPVADVLEAKEMLPVIEERIAELAGDVPAQLADKELRMLTALLIGKLPITKPVTAGDEQWKLNETNILFWRLLVNECGRARGL